MGQNQQVAYGLLIGAGALLMVGVLMITGDRGSLGVELIIGGGCVFVVALAYGLARSRGAVLARPTWRLDPSLRRSTAIWGPAALLFFVAIGALSDLFSKAPVLFVALTVAMLILLGTRFRR
ncbi:MAG: hypothetical protein QOJ29_2430 [Thermoleophilaceae bacterium]|jgi:hypothetical protein|nr:hypothetical protein [Thermoleophilaceae bacterium]